MQLPLSSLPCITALSYNLSFTLWHEAARAMLSYPSVDSPMPRNAMPYLAIFAKTPASLAFDR